MSIERIGTTRRWSDVVIHDRTVYVVEVPESVEGDVTTQARATLSSLEATLAGVGSGKDRMLMATIYLADIQEIDAFNAVWDAWVPEGTAPVRACVQAKLGKAGMKVEIQVVAAKR